MSFSTHTIGEGLQDAFKVKGSGRGVTYAGNIPGLRIDYMMTTPDFEVLDFKTLRMGLSDHYPLVTRVKFF
jgi:endonuclease/exonuclease/phosphatase family metal-dependent hydrolase